MRISVAVVFLIPILFLVFSIIKIITYIANSKDYQILLWGGLINFLEISILFTYWKIKGDIYALTTDIVFVVFLIFVPAIASYFFTFTSSDTTKKLGQLLSASVLTLLLFTAFHIFISSYFIDIFALLGIKTHY